MKKSSFHFSFFIFQLIVILLLAAGCNVNRDDPNRLSSLPAVTNYEELPLDSLLQLAAIAPSDTNLAMIYFGIARKYNNNDFEKAKGYHNKAGALSEQLDWFYGRCLYASSIANLLTREGYTDSAAVILQKGLELAVCEKDEVWIANFNLNMGNVYFIKDWFETALIWYMKALSFYEQWNSELKLKQTYNSISQVYVLINVLDKAIEFSEKSLALNNEDWAPHVNLGMAYSKQSQYEKAKGYFDEGLRLASLKNNRYMMGTIYSCLAENALRVFDFDGAEMYALKALEINRQFGAQAYCVDLLTLSKLELARGNHRKSEQYVQEALKLSTDMEALQEKQMSYMILSELAAAQGKYREYIQLWEELKKMEIVLAHETTLRAAEEMAAKYETVKKELEIENQQQVINRQNIQRRFFVAGIAVCVAILILLWYMFRLRTRNALALSERNNALSELNLALSEMNATKNKFFGIISHDLKNPALVQRNALQKLIKNARMWDVDTLTKYCNDLLKSADGQVELILNLLNWAQLQTDSTTYAPTTFNIAHRLRSDITLIRSIAQKKDITLIERIPDDADITADSNLLSTVVRNLMTNAVKFTPKGGRVEFSVEPSNHGKYAFSVSDTGVGMSREQICTLFRLDSAHSQPGSADEQGSGLGLIICREMLEKHSSQLHVESEEGKGSRFWFEV